MIPWLLALGVAVAPSPGMDVVVEVVDAPSLEAECLPVCIPMAPIAGRMDVSKGLVLLRIGDDDRTPVPTQVLPGSRELVFLHPCRGAEGARYVLSEGVPAEFAGPHGWLRKEGGRLWVGCGERRVLAYRFAPSSWGGAEPGPPRRGSFDFLAGLGGRSVLAEGDGGAGGLGWGWPRLQVGEASPWFERGAAAADSHRVAVQFEEIGEKIAGPIFTCFTVRNAWIFQSRRVAEEVLKLSWFAGPQAGLEGGGAYDLEFRLRALEPSVALAAVEEASFAGLGMALVGGANSRLRTVSLDLSDKSGVPQAAVVLGGSAEEGGEFSVVVLRHPDNPLRIDSWRMPTTGKPARGTLVESGGGVGPHPLSTEAPLKWRYRVLVRAGRLSDEWVQAHFLRWLSPLRVRILEN